MYKSMKDTQTVKLIEWAFETYSTDLAMTTAFGLNGVVLIHLVSEIGRRMGIRIPIIFLDTGYHFAETLETKRKMEARYNLNLCVYRPDPDLALASVQHLYAYDISTCCALRKVEPLQRAFADLQPRALLNGRSRHQSKSRVNLPAIEWQTDPIQLNPLFHWSRLELESFARRKQIPLNPLLNQGYPSIGCWPCTRPVQAGESIRSGRWAGTKKLECGLWTRRADLGQ